MTDVARFVTFAVTFAAGSALALGKLGNLGPSALGSILTLVRRPIVTAVLATVVALGTTVAMPVAGGAQEDPARETEQVAHRQALVAVEVDILKADDRQVTQALGDIKANVDAQTAELTAAEQALAAANAAVASADAAVADAQRRIDDLLARTDHVVVDAFVTPGTETALSMLSEESPSIANVKWAILDMQTSTDAALLAEYHAARDRLRAEKAKRDEAMAQARNRKAGAEAALADKQAAVSQQALFAAEVQARIDQKLSEAEMLKGVDPALAAQLQAEQMQLAAALNELDAEVAAELARRRAAELSAQAEVNKAAGVQDPPGGVVSVPCPGGGSIQVAGDISKPVGRLLTDAAEAGISMCGNGYRDPADQIAVRRANCGTSQYAIWQMPASYCSPPTARPGASMHEQGLAIDFTIGGGTIGYGSAAYDWLKAHAADYGLSNLPSEPWHWSTNGN
ncbi:MAG TPA: D-alanyl-D-alanine carboxypeptidase family protein [Acidimicrobiales bacterium]|jgi:multidrug efflux pump subunit AcrA (membrane-fusion protein)|nr:D-alanyl-D-alanine carboxypeptidase family protein [Acidimicrobiales bacterium]